MGNCPVCRKVFHTQDLEHVLHLVDNHSSQLVWYPTTNYISADDVSAFWYSGNCFFPFANQCFKFVFSIEGQIYQFLLCHCNSTPPFNCGVATPPIIRKYSACIIDKGSVVIHSGCVESFYCIPMLNSCFEMHEEQKHNLWPFESFE